MNTIQFKFTNSRQKNYFVAESNGVQTEQLSGISAVISNLLFENLNKIVTFEEIITRTHGQKPDYFIQRAIDVHLCKVKKFFEANGYAFERIRQTGVTITKAIQ